MNPRHIWQPYCSLAACQPERFTPDARVSWGYLCCGEWVWTEEWTAVCMWLLAREIPGEINPWNGEEDSFIYPHKTLFNRWWRMPYCGPFGSTNRAWYQPTSKVRCNPWCCEQRLVVQRYTNRPASFLKSSHLPYKLKSPLKRIPSSSTRITEDSPMEISHHDLDIVPDPLNQHYRKIEDSSPNKRRTV